MRGFMAERETAAGVGLRPLDPAPSVGVHSGVGTAGREDWQLSTQKGSWVDGHGKVKLLVGCGVVLGMGMKWMG